MAYEGYQGYGGGYGAADPASIRARLAASMLGQGTDSSPIRSPWQGAARMSQALMGALMLRRMSANDEANRASILGGPIGLPGQGGGGGGLPSPPPPAAAGPIAGETGAFPPSPLAGASAGIPAALTQPNGAAGGVPGGGPMPGGSMMPGNGFNNGGVQVASANPGFMPSFSEPASGNGPQGSGAGGSPMPLMGGLMNMGYSPFAAAGILGNFRQESSMNPAISGDGGTSLGLGQWHGARAQALQQFAQANGQDWRDPNVQIAFADREIKANPQLYQALNNARTPQEAADIFSAGFERPNPQYANNGNREAYAAQFANGAGGGQQPRPPLDPSMMFAGPGARGGTPQGQPGDIFGGLQNLFGGGPNPSSPQGGNAPSSAAQGGGNDVQGYVRRLMAISMDPNTSPYIREQAGQMVQMYLPYIMPHPTTWEPMPGTNNLAEKDWLGRFTGRSIGGPPKSEPVDMGTDFLGINHRGVIQNGQAIPFDWSGSGALAPPAGGGMPNGQPAPGGAPPGPSAGAPPQSGARIVQAAPGGAPTPLNAPPAGPQQAAPGGAPAPVPSRDPTSDPYTAVRVPGEDQLDSIVKANPQYQSLASTARAIIRGQQPPPVMGNAQTKPVDQAIMRLVYAADPNFNQAVAAARGKAVTDFTDSTTPNSPGGMIVNANTALGHLGRLAQASEELGALQSPNSHLLNRGKELWAENLDASGPYATALAKFRAAQTPFVDELGKFYAGGQGTEENRRLLAEAIDESSSPAERRAAFEQLSNLLQTKANELQRKWHTAMGPGSQDFPIFGDEAKAAIKQVGGLGQPKGAPKVGDVQKGYRFKGGDPSSPQSWEKQ